MRTMLPVRCWTMLLFGLATGSVAAQPRDLFRLDLTDPQMVLTAGGRSGACDALRFSPEGDALFAVGDDKVLHSWSVRGGELRYRPPARWNVFRERRGAIYALALTPKADKAAVGGFGRLNGDVAILNTATGDVLAALSGATDPDYQTSATVWSLAYHPDGQRVAIGLQDGAVYEWTPAAKKVVRLAEPTNASGAKVVWVGYTGDSVRFARMDGGVSEAQAGAVPRELFRFGSEVAHVVATPDGSWLAGSPLNQTTAGSTVILRAVAGGEPVVFPFGRDRMPESLALTPGKLAVGCRVVSEHDRYSSRRAGDLTVFDLSATPPRVQATAKFEGENAFFPQQIVFHPDGRMLALAGGPDHTTQMYKIDGDTVRPAGTPAVGVGRGVFQVATRDDGTTLLFRQTAANHPATPNDRGTGDWRAFDLSKLGWGEVKDGPTEEPIREMNGWTVESDPKNEFAWTAVNGEFRYPLTVDSVTADRPVCYTFLKAPAPRWTRLAVGYYWGFYVFDLRGGFAPRLVARGVGHHGQVTSIAPARAGKMLVTGSNDQTIGLWTLQPWDHHPLLGAKCEWQFDATTQDRAFVVTAVHAGSPAWEMGLIAGDRITKLGWNGAWVEKPSDWEATLAKLEPDRELAVLLVRQGTDGKPIPAKTTLLTRPQARFFPTVGHDWVLYKYADFYYACSTNGEAYLGWQLSGKTAADAPEFHPADRFRDVFYKPSAVRDAVVKLIREPDRPLARSYLPPGVEIQTSADTILDKPVTITVSVRPRSTAAGQLIPLEKVELWLDDEVLLKSWPGSGTQEFRDAVEIPADRLRVGKNKLTAVAHARTRGEATASVQHTPPVTKLATLRGVAVGVDKYPYLTADGQLSAAGNDAKLIREAFGGLAAKAKMHTSQMDVILDTDATPEMILKKIEAAGKGLGPDDWLVVFLAGHGFAEPDLTAATKRMRPGSWFFCAAAPGFDGKAVAAAGTGDRQIFDFSKAATERDLEVLVGGLKKINCTISGTALLDRLANLPCRKLVLLDSCHSGAIQQDPGRDLRPNGRGAVVLTASAPDETASEFDIELVRNGKRVVERHGFFTAAVYAALTNDKADRNGDGLLTLEELQQAVAAEVKAARVKAGLDRPGSRSQTVLVSPPDLRDVVFVGK